MLFDFMLFIIVVSCLLTSITSEQILKYAIEEESPIHTSIVDLATVLHLSSDARLSLSALLPIHENLFDIDQQSTFLRTTTIIDRDLCNKRMCSCYSCVILLQLRIERSYNVTATEIIIEIHVKDRNDHAPEFDQSTVRHDIHIKENVPLGYRLVLPRANDPDEGTFVDLEFISRGRSIDCVLCSMLLTRNSKQ
jgi:hypothetical protein